MKKIRIKIMALGLAFLTGVLVSGCGSNSSLNNAGQSSSSAGQTSGSQEEKQENKMSDSKKEQQEPQKTASNDAECVAVIERLRETTPVVPAEKKVLEEMARCVTFSRILDDQGVMFHSMSENKRASLRYQFFQKMAFGKDSSVFGNALQITNGSGEFEYCHKVNKKDALDFFHDIYGEESMGPLGYEKEQDEYLMISFGDGEPWIVVDHDQLFEDENYFLLRGPAFYGDNGGAAAFKGYAEILYAKDKDSRYGVKLLYGRYNNNGKAEIASADTSSNLPSENGKSYTGANLFDGDYSTAWAEGVPGTGVGETITLHLSKEQQVYGIQIYNGYLADYDLYDKNGMLTDVSVDFGKGSVKQSEEFYGNGFEGATQESLREQNLFRVELDEPVMTDTITITITGAKAGSRYDDTCVSEIVVY